MTTLFWFWVVTFTAWGLVMIVSAKGAWAAAFGGRDDVRQGDPMRLATFLVASLFVAHNLRWLLVPGNLSFMKAIYVVSILVAFYVFKLMFAYGRGDFVGHHGEGGHDNG
jgi:hypothetical protein